MIEVTFSDSAAGGLKCARAFSHELWESEVICLGIMADIGDITEPMFGQYRYKLIYKMLYREQWGADKEMRSELKSLGKTYARQYTRLKQGIKDGKPVRVWYDGTPASMCGVLWLSGKLAKYKAEVYVVELGRYNTNTDIIANSYSGDVSVIRRDWGECEPREFAEALLLSRRVSREELTANSIKWQRLVNENSRLRAVISEQVVSVPVSFYDFLILRYLGKRPTTQAVLIGKIIGENQLGVGDWLFASRIEYLISRKIIEISEDNKQKYQRVLVRAKTP